MPEAEDKTEDSKEADRVFKIAESGQIDDVYFNGFANGLSHGDVRIVLTLNGQPNLSLNCSYTVAKTLALKLAVIVQTLENVTGTQILTTEDVARALQSKKV